MLPKYRKRRVLQGTRTGLVTIQEVNKQNRANTVTLASRRLFAREINYPAVVCTVEINDFHTIAGGGGKANCHRHDNGVQSVQNTPTASLQVPYKQDAVAASSEELIVRRPG